MGRCRSGVREEVVTNPSFAELPDASQLPPLPVGKLHSIIKKSTSDSSMNEHGDGSGSRGVFINCK